MKPKHEIEIEKSIKRLERLSKQIQDESAELNSWIETYHGSKSAHTLSRRVRELSDFSRGMVLDLHEVFNIGRRDIIEREAKLFMSSRNYYLGRNLL